METANRKSAGCAKYYFCPKLELGSPFLALSPPKEKKSIAKKLITSNPLAPGGAGFGHQAFCSQPTSPRRPRQTPSFTFILCRRASISLNSLPILASHLLLTTFCSPPILVISPLLLLSVKTGTAWHSCPLLLEQAKQVPPCQLYPPRQLLSHPPSLPGVGCPLAQGTPWL